MIHYDMRDSCRISCASFSLSKFVIATALCKRIHTRAKQKKHFFDSVTRWLACVGVGAVSLCNVNDVEKRLVDGNINVIMNDIARYLHS